MGKLINIIQGSHRLISNLPGSALRTLVVFFSLKIDSVLENNINPDEKPHIVFCGI